MCLTNCNIGYSINLVPPLFVIEFLHRVVETFDDYFSECTESLIKENYVVVYEVSFFNDYYL